MTGALRIVEGWFITVIADHNMYPSNTRNALQKPGSSRQPAVPVTVMTTLWPGRSTAFTLKMQAPIKAGVIHRRGPWRSFEAVEYAMLEWVEWFNTKRILEPIGNIPPAEAEEHYYAMLDEQPMAA